MAKPMPPTDGIAIGIITSAPRPVARDGHEGEDRRGDGHQARAYPLEARVDHRLADLLLRGERAVLEYAFKIGPDHHAVVVHHAEEHQNPTHTATDRFTPQSPSIMKPPEAETSTPKKIAGAIHQQLKPR